MVNTQGLQVSGPWGGKKGRGQEAEWFQISPWPYWTWDDTREIPSKLKEKWSPLGNMYTGKLSIKQGTDKHDMREFLGSRDAKKHH